MILKVFDFLGVRSVSRYFIEKNQNACKTWYRKKDELLLIKRLTSYTKKNLFSLKWL